MFRLRSISLLLPFLSSGLLQAADTQIPEKVRFNRDVRPILSDNCFHCHGFDKKERKADRRLDTRDGALADNDGVKAIVPGKPDDSEAWLRILSEDPDEMMPPPKGGKKLSERDRAIIRRWIEQGATYEQHWAYTPPKRPEVPHEQGGGAPVRHPIDALVRADLTAAGLQPSAEADRRTLIRRLSFDLIGLPPTASEVRDFENASDPDAYDKLVDRLLASPYFGERMALPWLDAVRYADTIGYHSDNPRNVWPYRDYVIRSFNENKRFDQFTREQLAGDLLPHSTQDQKVASAFNRLLLSTEEGGAQPKDYEARMLTDRVRAVGTAWLGATIGCAQCHDHKFDPITSKDFYSMGAFFADIEEPIIGKREDGMLVATPEEEATLAKYDAELKAAEAKLQVSTPEIVLSQRQWEATLVDGNIPEPVWTPLHGDKFESEKGASITQEAGEIIRTTPPEGRTDLQRLTLKSGLGEITGFRLEALKSSRLPGTGPGNASKGNFVLTEITVEVNGETVPIQNATATYEQKNFPAKNTIDGVVGKKNGWGVQGKLGADHSLYLELAQPLRVAPEQAMVVTLRYDYGENHTIGKLRISATNAAKPIRAPQSLELPKEVAEALAIPFLLRTPAQEAVVAGHYRTIAPELDAVRKDVADAKKTREDYDKSLARCLVSKSLAKPRTVRLLPRGNWMDETGETMKPALPGFLTAEKPAADRQLTRLDLAEWLVSRENPLTARVFVNRLWKQFFGMGLSKVLDDFGAQGEPPVHPELLDWLACEFMDSGWDVKHVIRLIVTSQTYQQVSTASKELQTRDPYNRLLARQSRWRLDAELVRDNALAISGLLVYNVGGPSVKPYQPDGYWENLNFPARTYEASKGEDQYRRGLYTWWQRSYLHPSLLAFDAPTREECAADRVRSNIPQQALVLLNDPTYVEAARVLAQRAAKRGQGLNLARFYTLFTAVLQRSPTSEEVDPLMRLLTESFNYYREHPEDAKALIAIGNTPAPKELDPVTLAAWTNVTRALLNLHETVTRY